MGLESIYLNAFYQGFIFSFCCETERVNYFPYTQQVSREDIFRALPEAQFEVIPGKDGPT